ncbi:MAG: aspartyl protease family protein [Bacteroidales bacterium]
MTKQTLAIEKIDLDSNGTHLLVETELTNEKTFFILDTGASKSVIDNALLTHIEHTKIETDDLQSSHISGMIAGEIIEIPHLHFNTFSCPDFQALAMSLEHINTLYKEFTNKPISGLLGGDFFNTYNAEINYKTNTITLEVQ